MSVRIRESVEAVLLDGIRVWGLPIAEDDVRGAMRFIEDDAELLQVGQSLGVPSDALERLSALLQESPELLSGDEARRALGAVGKQMQQTTGNVAEARTRVEPVLRRTADPERWEAVLGTLALLSLEGVCPEAKRICLEVSHEGGLSDYAQRVGQGDWELARRAHDWVRATGAGQAVSGILGRQVRRAFTCCVAGTPSHLARVLADFVTAAVRESEDGDD